MKKIIKFIFIMFGLLILGGIAGFLLAMGSYTIGFSELNGRELLENLLFKFFGGFGAYLFFGVLILCLIIILSLYFSTRKKAEKMMNLDDDDYEIEFKKFNKKATLSMVTLTISDILLWICFIAFVYTSIFDENTQRKLMDLIFTAFTFFAFQIFNVLIQRSIVNLLKKLDPRYKGDVLDKSFHKHWMDSLDEYEKIHVYKAGFKTYSLMSILLTALVLILSILTVLLQMGLFTVILLSLLRIFLFVSYAYYAKEEESEQPI